jgi:spermidine synthase
MQKVFSKFEIRDREIKNVLLLGFGAGSIASILQKEYKKKLKIIGVEKDPVVVDLARKYFSLGKFKDLELYTEDAYDFVRNCNNKFDMIVMDVFVDVNVPDKFLEKEFISSLGDLLSVRGILFFNLVVYTERIRDKGNLLFNYMNELIGNTDWMRLNEHPTENWIFVTDKTKKPESSFLE